MVPGRQARFPTNGREVRTVRRCYGYLTGPRGGPRQEILLSRSIQIFSSVSENQDVVPGQQTTV